MIEDKYLTERVDTLKKTQLKQLKMISYLENYKKAWEELREDNQLPIPFIELLSELMQNLEEKHGIEVE